MACDHWSNEGNDPCGKCGPCQTVGKLRAEGERQGEMLRRSGAELKANRERGEMLIRVTEELKTSRARIEELESVNPELIPQHLLNEARAEVVKLKNELKERTEGVRVRDVAKFIDDHYERALRRIVASHGPASEIARVALKFPGDGESVSLPPSDNEAATRLVALGAMVMRYRMEHNKRHVASLDIAKMLDGSSADQCDCPICLDAAAHYKFREEQRASENDPLAETLLRNAEAADCQHEVWGWRGGVMQRFCKDCDVDLEPEYEMVKKHIPYHDCMKRDCRQCNTGRD